ncbi:YlbF family regulator [Cytobacillus sp. S13-E01]|uniref:YlbF family regulator n=1 Tax=Cytobacillus sp. S13-E01 TaxID=3031326 RepID=UPI0023D88B37|nr:YlbF family regulator [Cytobacillus sp. S13-E01]MDF0725307.1 YlbF family regulator [Cytobacillus sp. S13-E01]
MLATLERVEILGKTEDLANMILQSDIADDYRRCLYKLGKDQTAQQLISKFVIMKEKYEEVQRFGKYHPDYKTVTLEIRELKRTLDLNEIIYAFKKAEENLQSILDEISVLLGSAISENIKVPSGNPYFDSMSCGGGCGSGGGCGCK